MNITTISSETLLDRIENRREEIADLLSLIEEGDLSIGTAHAFARLSLLQLQDTQLLEAMGQ